MIRRVKSFLPKHSPNRNTEYFLNRAVAKDSAGTLTPGRMLSGRETEVARRLAHTALTATTSSLRCGCRFASSLALPQLRAPKIIEWPCIRCRQSIDRGIVCLL